MNQDLPDSISRRIADANLSYLLGRVEEAVVYVDRDFVVRYVNDVYLQNLQLKASDVIDKTPFEYLPSFRRSVFYEVINECRLQGRPYAAINYSVVTKRWVLLRAMPCDGGALLLVNDASEDLLKQLHLAQRATRDHLTGIGNKVALVQEIDRLSGEGQTFALAVIGLNRLGVVNDTIGFAGGDRALVEIASRLQSLTVEGELLCRLAGDDFALLSEQTGPEFEARVAALIAETQQALSIEGHEFMLGSMAGLIASSQHTGRAEELLKGAALALRHCKRDGGGSLAWYEPSMESASQRRAETEDELRKAIRDGSLSLALQPKGGLPGRHIVGAEALVRWHHPTRGVIPPGQFLPIAQECGLMIDIDRWVIGRAVDTIRRLKALGHAIPVSINLSVQALGDAQLVSVVERALKEAGVEPSLLEIEIPEGALMRDVAASGLVLSGLDRLGVAISIDDFGTGYSSFAYLAKFPVGTLKIDRSFVADMGGNKQSRKIVKGLIQLAHSLSMKVVAEGVETESQLLQLQGMHCDEIQGYGYGHPMPFEAFCEFAERHRGHARISAFSI